MQKLNSPIYLSTILLAILLIACNSSEENKSVSISGTITNPVDNKVQLSSADMKLVFQLDENNSFDTTLTLNEGRYNLRHGRESTKIYLVPGTDLNITVNNDLFDESISYTGTGATNSIFLAKKYLHREENNMDSKALFSQNEEDFLKTLDDQAISNTSFLENYEGLGKGFYNEELKSIEYEKLLSIADYQVAHRYFTKSMDFEASDKITNMLSDVNLDDEKTYKEDQSYARLVNSIIVNQEMKDALSKLKSINSQDIKESVLQNLKYELRPGIKDLDFTYNEMVSLTQDSVLLAELATTYEKCKLLEPGKDSPKFNYVDRNGDYVSLEDLKGKNVYVDVWATWCGPCLAEVPFLKEVEEKYRSQNIEFVSVSIDNQKDKEKWLAMIDKENLGGLQLFADKDWKSDFVVNYNIKGIPRFIIIDDEGKIVSPDAPRPSSGKDLEDVFSSLSSL